MLTTPAIGMALGAPILFLGYWVDEWHIAIALIFIPTVFNASYYGPTFACVHGLVRPEARAMASAILLFVQTLVGLGLGPLRSDEHTSELPSLMRLTYADFCLKKKN